MEHWLERHFCTPDIPNCLTFLKNHFAPCHKKVMQEFMHPDMVCTIWGYC
jgi:hypothetical protein